MGKGLLSGIAEPLLRAIFMRARSRARASSDGPTAPTMKATSQTTNSKAMENTIGQMAKCIKGTLWLASWREKAP